MSIFDLFRQIESAPRSSAPISYCICGLGNPGPEYAATRHNMGFLALDEIAKKTGATVKTLKFKGMCGEATYNGKRILLLKPQTYMNLSGQSVRAAMDFYKLSPDKLVVLCDDLEQAPGRIRVRAKGSSGGQKGLKSIIEHLGSEDFPRVRIGIGRPQAPGYAISDYVVGRIPEADKPHLQDAILRAACAALEVVDSSPESAASKYNGNLPK